MNQHIFLVRHGLVPKAPEKIFFGQTDPSLSDLGRDQAERLGRFFSSIELTRLVTSDLKRAMETAVPIARAQGLPVEPFPSLREIDLGQWEGLGFAEVKNRFPEKFRQRGLDLANFSPPGGESFADLSRRVMPAFDTLVSETQGPLMIVTHIGVIRVVLCRLVEARLQKMFFFENDCGAFSLVRKNEKGFRLLALNKVPFPGE